MPIMTDQELTSIREDFQTIYKSSNNDDPDLFDAATRHFQATINQVIQRHNAQHPKPTPNPTNNETPPQ